MIVQKQVVFVVVSMSGAFDECAVFPTRAIAQKYVARLRTGEYAIVERTVRER